MTPDGRLVAFNSGQAVFVKNTQTGLLTQASPPAGTVPQVTGFFGGVLLDDGNKLVFLTIPLTTYVGAYQVANVIPARLMVRDLTNGSLVVLATDNGIVAQGEVASNRFAISPDGTRVAFVSSSASLVPGDTNGRPDVFVRDLVDGTTLLASSTSGGGELISRDGTRVVFGSVPAIWCRGAHRPMFFRSTRRPSLWPLARGSDQAAPRFGKQGRLEALSAAGASATHRAVRPLHPGARWGSSRPPGSAPARPHRCLPPPAQLLRT